MTNGRQTWEVRIALQRVQTYLFAVPRLKAMVGANAMLGQTLRIELKERACRCKAKWPGPGKPPRSLGDLDQLEAVKNDPLRSREGKSLDLLPDDIAAGILARDGGHFVALFANAEDANRFAAEAEECLRDRLPGLRFTIERGEFGVRSERVSSPATVDLLDLPQLQVCEESGREPASMQDPDSKRWISADVQRRNDWYAKFKNGMTNDVIGLLQYHGNLKYCGTGFVVPDDFHKLCGDGYLAVIHADGNGIGQACRELTPAGSARTLEGELAVQTFYRSMRGAVRCAVTKALETAFKESSEQSPGNQPYQLLMLGGDDLLLVCPARDALGFVVAYARELKKLTTSDGKKLTIGAGVVIAPPTFPFFRLHQMAESLASSAKTLYRGMKPRKESVVDWMITTEAWSDDPIAVRRRDWVLDCTTGDVRERLLLSRRPCQILGEGLDSLEGLLAARGDMMRVARSQRRHLMQQLSRGHHTADLAYIEILRKLTGDARDTLIRTGLAKVWQPGADGGPVTTSLLDLIEITEIATLGRKPAGIGPSRGGTPA